MDVRLLIKSRLDELGLEQKDLAAAAEVTESYVSQLLSRKKLPPAPDRTDIYEKMEGFLKLSAGKLAKLAHAQRTEHLRRGLEEPPAPLFRARQTSDSKSGRYSSGILSASSSASSRRSFWT